MEQIQQLLELLKQTPEMALWGITIYFVFILAKLSSWILAVKLVASQFIKRFFDYRDRQIDNKEERNESNICIALEKIKTDKAEFELHMNNERNKLNEALQISKYFKNNSIDKDQVSDMFRLFEAIKSTTYIHKGDVAAAILIINKNKD